ncbi:MAG: LysM peptidoglycan-binding domain-containing M23 family metallopeptidase [Chloroflexota bacterium]
MYAVEDGDVLGVIADLFGVTIDALVEANDLPDETSIAVGQLLIIPGVTATPRPSLGPTTTSNANLLGMHLIMPIAGACLTPSDDQMPNAPREYRSGIHEGVDFFTSYACVDVPKGLPELAVADGTIIRADRDYRALTQAQIEQLQAESAAQGFTSAGTLDKFRGRQVWIDHENGIVTRYSHLDGIPREVQVGVEVKQGDIVGYVGDSGTPGSATNPDFEIHLHFEIRVGDTFLGAGLDPAETRAVYEAVFGITPAAAP